MDRDDRIRAAVRAAVPEPLRRRSRRHLLPLYQRTIRELHELGYLFLELTHRCNLDCLHCGSDCQASSTDPDLPRDDLLRVLGEIAEKYDPHKITVVLSGGEPLCYPRVFDLGAELHRLGFPWGMVTNGWAWDEAAFARARAAHMASVTVSLDGLEAEHDWLRNRPGSWQRATATIRRLAADRFVQVMDAITCVNQRSFDTLDDIYQLVGELGLTRWRLFTISPIGRATQRPELFLSPAQYRALMARILAWRERGGLQVDLSESGYLGPCLENRVRGHDYFCSAGIRVGGVMVNGDILACPNIDRRFRQGNIHRDSFVDVWEHRFQAFRDRSWTRTGRCGACDQWAWCQGNGMHLWDLDRHEPRLCHYQDFGLRDFDETRERSGT
jgi:radical SAM protein with 4Fe4S-binding SPASM domain